MAKKVAQVAIEIVPAPRLVLHGPTRDDAVLPRTDCNSPVLREDGRALAFVSHYEPRGQTWRRVAADPFDTTVPLERIELRGDPAPQIGKWIESIWREPGARGGRLYGWYHAEEPADCPVPSRKLFVPHIGALVSDDDGASWRWLGELLRAPPDQIDCGFENGFVTGGYGDFSVVAEGDHFYLHYSSYVALEAAQGVCDAHDGDTRADLVARFFIAGVSEWEIRFGRAARGGPAEVDIAKAPLDPGW